jgi:hypothetical protein
MIVYYIEILTIGRFIPNLTPAGALTLAATVSRRTANPLRDFLHRYLLRETLFTVSTVRFLTWLPYLMDSC